jgi:hypothetical protein
MILFGGNFDPILDGTFPDEFKQYDWPSIGLSRLNGLTTRPNACESWVLGCTLGVIDAGRNSGAERERPTPTRAIMIRDTTGNYSPRAGWTLNMDVQQNGPMPTGMRKPTRFNLQEAHCGVSGVHPTVP